MSINDVQNELNNIKANDANIKDTTTEAENDANDAKTIKSILKKNIINLESFVEGKVINMYARSWNKLEPKLKRTKMTEFLQALVDKNEFDIITFNTLIKLLHNKINFNRKLNVTYDHETCVITTFDYSIYL